MLERRKVLGGLAGGAALVAAGRAVAMPQRRLKRFGLQLYTLREAAKADPIGTLERVKALGYSEVQVSGAPYSTIEPSELRRQLNRVGLTAPAIHVPMDQLEADAGKLFAQARILGADYIVLPWLNGDRRSTLEQCVATAAQLTRFGKAAKDAGLTFAYHNHSFEFVPVEGRLPFDIFFGETDPELVKIELDFYWAAKAGADIPAIFDRYPGRIPVCHVKDMKVDGSITEVGAGTIDFAKLFALSGKAGLIHYFVEQDEPPSPIGRR